MNRKINVIVPFYNVEKYLERCVSSIMSQKYDNFHVYFINDMSTDDSWKLLPQDDKRTTCINNTIRKTALENIHDVIMKYCEEDSVAVIVDGDDFLIGKDVLKYINDFYDKTDCWCMYGSCLWSSTGRRGFETWYTPEEFATLRTSPFKVSHVRSFYAGVYHRIKDQDPEFTCMKDIDGNFYKSCYDVCVMWPVMELSSFDKVKYNDKVLYMYNFENPISDHRVDQALQTGIHMEVSKKPRFRQIKNYKK